MHDSMVINTLRGTLTKISRRIGSKYKGLEASIIRDGYHLMFDGETLLVGTYKTSSIKDTAWVQLAYADLVLVSRCLRYVPEIKEKLRAAKDKEDGLADELMEEARSILSELGKENAE